jgi:hypothetical protein
MILSVRILKRCKRYVKKIELILYHTLTHIFNNEIQISGVNYTFYSGSSFIEYTKSTNYDDKYVIVFDDSKGYLVIVDSSGNTIKDFVFSTLPVKHLSITSIDNGVFFSYYIEDDNLSYVREYDIENDILYDKQVFYYGKADNTKINKINNDRFILTYSTETQGIIQIIKPSVDHIFSMGVPFIFNNDTTLFSNSVYLTDNVVVIYYDIDDQLKIKNCRIYDDYIGIGLPTIIKANYCFNLEIGKFNDNYVYVNYYDAEDGLVKLSILKIDDDITSIDQDYSIDSLLFSSALSTINENRFVISYEDVDYNGVYRIVDLSGGTFETIINQYNLFDIDLRLIDVSEFKGHNDYWFYYENEIIEKGVLKIN